MEDENKKEFTIDNSNDESPEGLNNLFGLSDSGGFKNTDMKSDSNFSRGRKTTQKEAWKQKKVWDKTGDNPSTVPQKSNTEGFDINVPEKVTPKSESEWSQRAADIAKEKAEGMENYYSLSGPEKSAADYQISSSTKTDIANERAEEKKKIADYTNEMKKFDTPLSTFKANLEELTAEDRKIYDDASAVANDMTIDEARRKQAQKIVDELEVKGSKLVSDTRKKEYVENKQREMDIKNSEAILANPDGKTPDEINNAKKILRERDTKQRIDQLVSEGKTPDEAGKIAQEENEYNDISSEYLESLKSLQNDPYAGEWAKEQMDIFNYQNQLAEKYPNLISKKTSSEILKKSIADRARVTQLQKAGKEREAKLEAKRLAEQAKRRRQVISQAMLISGSIAARLLPLLYIRGITTGR